MDDAVREYLLIGLGMGLIAEGVVDAYVGPPELAEEARAAGAAPLELAARARALRARLVDLPDAQRARWLDGQLVALETLGRGLAGEELAYVEEVTRCFDAPPYATPAEEYAEARRELDELLPGTGALRERLVTRDERMTIPPERLPSIADWLLVELRRAAAALFDLPSGEQLSVAMVADEPWSAYNWYQGDLRSLIQINTDLPMRAHFLIHLLAHEAYPGHHLEHVSKESGLIRRMGRFEAAIQLINTPEAYMSEGLAEVGVRFVAPPQRWQQLLLDICSRADITLSPADAEREWRITTITNRLGGSSGDAALQLYVDGRAREQVLAFLEQDALRPRESAEKTLDFITHPLWRTYVFCYAGGERLLNAWLDEATDESERVRRYGRLLMEQLTPSRIAEETPIRA